MTLIDFSDICNVWKNNDLDTKFKMHQLVRNKINGICYEIKGVNRQNVCTVEYALIGYPFLVYEQELEEI